MKTIFLLTAALIANSAFAGDKKFDLGRRPSSSPNDKYSISTNSPDEIERIIRYYTNIATDIIAKQAALGISFKVTGLKLEANLESAGCVYKYYLSISPSIKQENGAEIRAFGLSSNLQPDGCLVLNK